MLNTRTLIRTGKYCASMIIGVFVLLSWKGVSNIQTELKLSNINGKWELPLYGQLDTESLEFDDLAGHVEYKIDTLTGVGIKIEKNPFEKKQTKIRIIQKERKSYIFETVNGSNEVEGEITILTKDRLRINYHNTNSFILQNRLK